MSSQQQQNMSRTQILKVKGVSFNYVQFLWTSLGQIKQVQARRDYASAMQLLADLIRWLPDSLKEEFREKVIKIERSMNHIKAGTLAEIRRIPDFYIRGIFKHKLLQTYADKAFSSLIDELSTKLNQMGYMENTEKVLEGEDDWYALHRKDSDKKKRQAAKQKGAAGKFQSVE